MNPTTAVSTVMYSLEVVSQLASSFIFLVVRFTSLHFTSRVPNDMDGMNKLHGPDIQVHLIFLQDILCAPSLEGEFSRISLGILPNLGTVRPYQSLDSVRIIEMRWNRHRLDDRIELNASVIIITTTGIIGGLCLLCYYRLALAISSIVVTSSSTVVLQWDFLSGCGEDILLILLAVPHCAIRCRRRRFVVNTKTSYQSMADLGVTLYSHGG